MTALDQLASSLASHGELRRRENLARHTTFGIGGPADLFLTVRSAGSLAIATNAGELFVEWGIEVKKRSPFPHTVLSELTNDWVGYEPTKLASEHEGYESLAGVNYVSLEGIQKLVDTAIEMLDELWKKVPEQPQAKSESK